MRKSLYYIGVLALTFLFPVTRLDIAKLEPVEAVAITVEDQSVVLSTDTESVGKGATAEEALADLKRNAQGIIYLDTARFLLIGDHAEDPALQLRRYLKSSVRIGSYMGTDVKEEAAYLDAHEMREKPKG